MDVHIQHVHIHIEDSEDAGRLFRIERVVMAIKDQVTSIKGLVNAIFEGTNLLAGQATRIGSGVDALQQTVAELKALVLQNGQPDAETQALLDETEAQASTIKDQLATLATNLEAIGTDAETPVPDPEPLPDDGEGSGGEGGDGEGEGEEPGGGEGEEPEPGGGEGEEPEPGGGEGEPTAARRSTPAPRTMASKRRR